MARRKKIRDKNSKQLWAEDCLRAHAEYLRRQIELMRRNPVTAPATARFEHIASGFERYLSGEMRTLGQALGVERGRGNPGKQGKHFELAKRIVPMRAAQTWAEIAEEIDKESRGPIDDGTLRRIYRTQKSAVMEWYAEQIRKRLGWRDPK